MSLTMAWKRPPSAPHSFSAASMPAAPRPTRSVPLRSLRRAGRGCAAAARPLDHFPARATGGGAGEGEARGMRRRAMGCRRRERARPGAPLGQQGTGARLGCRRGKGARSGHVGGEVGSLLRRVSAGALAPGATGPGCQAAHERGSGATVDLPSGGRPSLLQTGAAGEGGSSLWDGGASSSIAARSHQGRISHRFARPSSRPLIIEASLSRLSCRASSARKEPGSGRRQLQTSPPPIPDPPF